MPREMGLQYLGLRQTEQSRDAGGVKVYLTKNGFSEFHKLIMKRAGSGKYDRNHISGKTSVKNRSFRV